MLWVLWDIFLPVLAAFLTGLFVGWLLWRWRRSRVDTETLTALRRNCTRLKNDADKLRARNAELSDRLQTASVVSVTTPEVTDASTELAAAKSRIETLSSELKSSRLEVNRLSDGSAGAPVPGSADKPQVNRIRDLEARLQGANRKIADLQQAAREQIDSGPESEAADPGFTQALAVRDQMIETLKKSLAQYGDASDVTTLAADLELRDNRIAALEDQLEKIGQKIIR